MKRRLTLGAAAAACALLLCYPMEALLAARDAMRVWAEAFAPALFPFFVVLPALCCPEAAQFYEKVLGGAMRRFAGCPGRAAGSMAVGMMAGSPAGAAALRRVADGMTRGEATRALLLCSGVSPAFLVASVGGAMLNAPDAGHILMRAQIAALCLSGLILRRAFSGEADVVSMGEEEKNFKVHPVREAVISVLTVCGWMVCFSVIARIATAAAPSLRTPLLPVLEIAGGASAIAQAPMNEEMRLVLLGLACGFGGLAILMQNRAQMPCVKWKHLALGKILQGALCAGCTWAQLRFRVAAQGEMASPVWAALWMSSALTVLVALGWRALAARRARQCG